VVDDTTAMRAAIAAAATVRTTTSPNPWVGAVVVDASGQIIGTGATQPPGGPHAEREALGRTGPSARGATLVTTLEPCNHTGRTPPCTDAVIAAGIARVVVGIEDPDPLVAGQGIAALRAAGIDVTVGVEAAAVTDQLAPYLTHRRTGRPHVVLKLAATVDGRTAAPDGTSQWITGDAARADAHRLRAESDAVLVGAGTVRTDDPSLTVRHVEGRDPLRVVLGRAPAGARIHPCVELSGDLGVVLDDLGGRGVLQVLVEGGATVAHAFHAAGLVDRYVVYLAPAVFGGDDALGLFRGPAAPTIGALSRGRFTSVCPLGDDVRLDLVMDRPHD
jgi:diaminohydroxyphosphoribosylaminopyrimidine deaminase/5-amino-6-(5-phosphoribosylamino)uracil reductase